MEFRISLYLFNPKKDGKQHTAWKVSKYGVISGPYFPVFGPNTGKYGPEITPYLDTFHAVTTSQSALTCKFIKNEFQHRFYYKGRSFDVLQSTITVIAKRSSFLCCKARRVVLKSRTDITAKGHFCYKMR